MKPQTRVRVQKDGKVLYASVGYALDRSMSEGWTLAEPRHTGSQRAGETDFDPLTAYSKAQRFGFVSDHAQDQEGASGGAEGEQSAEGGANTGRVQRQETRAPAEATT